MTWLLDVTLRSSAILLVGLALMPLLRRRSAALRHCVLFASISCAGAVPLATWLLPEWEAPVSVSTLVPLSAPGPGPSSRAAAETVRRAGTTSAADGERSRATERTPLFLWLAGTTLSLVALGFGLIRLWRLDKAARALDTPAWLDALAHLRPPAAAKNAIDMRVTEHPGLLLVWGLRRSSIVIPASALSWPRDRVAPVLAHELAHVDRRDWLLLILSELVRALYWFNPLVWIACARLRAECEVACDDVVITSGHAAAEYAAHVVSIAQELNSNHGLPAPAAVRASTLERRVRAMLDKTSNRWPLSARGRHAAWSAVALLTLAVAAVAAQSFVSLSGTIVDPSNGVLPGVTLALRNEETQAKYEIKTDRTGRYEFVGLPPGDYTIEAALPGFARFAGRVVVGTQNVQQDLTLTIGMVEERITVRDGAEPAPPDPERVRKLEEIKRRQLQSTVAPPAQPGRGQPGVRMGGNIRVPLKYRDVRPDYPASMRGSDGVVVLRTTIGLTGAVEDIEVVSSTHPDFAQSAIDAVRQWEFSATLLNGEPIVTPMRVTVNYRVAP
jgi:TonB family protein